MAKGQIKQKIVLEGEQEYNQAIKDASRNIKTLQSAIKAETAELGKNATAEQKAQAQAKSLKQQIAEQEKIVKAYREELEQVKQRYGDNEDAVARYEQKLNAARTTLANMKNELSGIGSTMTSVKSATAESVTAVNSLGESLSRIGDFGESASERIESVFTGMLDRIQSVVTTIMTLVNEAAERADSYGDIATTWGTDSQTIQQYSRAVEAVGKDFNTLNSAVNRIIYGGKGKDIAEMLGLSGVNYDNDWEYAMLVMNRLSEMSKKGANMDSIYETIFGGKKAEGVTQLIGDWDRIQGYLQTFNGNNGGFGMSDEELENMQQVFVLTNELETKWKAIQDHIASAFAPVVLDLGVNVNGALDGLNDLMNAKDDEDREEALKKIRENVEAFCRKIGDAIKAGLEVLSEVAEELKGSDDPVVAAVGGILGTLTDSLEWIINNQEGVQTALKAIFGGWLIMKLMAIAGQLSSIVKSIETIKMFKAWSIPTGGGGSGAATGTAAGAAAGATAGGAAGWGSLWSGIRSKLFKGPSVLAFLGTLFENALTEQGNDDLEVDEDTGKVYIKQTGEEINPTPTQQTIDVSDVDPEVRAAAAAKSIHEEVEDELLDDDGMFSVSDAQKQAAEDYWDAWVRNLMLGNDNEDDYMHFRDAFEENEETMTALLSAMESLFENPELELPDDLPEWFWKVTQNNNNGNDADGTDFSRLPGQIEEAVKKGAENGVSGIVVNLDGYKVGTLVAPYVSQEITHTIYN